MIALLLAVALTPAFGSSEGVPAEALANYSITGFSRPCCNFGLDIIPQRLGLAGVIDPAATGAHIFARQPKGHDNVGIAYTCGGGFVDVSHLRDNADWSAHVYWNLSQWLGSGTDVLARREGGFGRRSVYFPNLTASELAQLTEDDRAQIAVSIGYSMALLHEIATSFNIAVSAPASLVIYETSSAFSVEDAYSNLMGNILGVAAARDPRPYNLAMAGLIDNTLANLGAQTASQTRDAYTQTRGTWWRRNLLAGFGSTLKRDFTHEGEVVPFLINDRPGCGGSLPQAIEVPGLLSNGRHAQDYYEVRGNIQGNLRRGLRSVGVEVRGNVITQRDFPRIIEGIKKKFVGKLGEAILTP